MSVFTKSYASAKKRKKILPKSRRGGDANSMKKIAVAVSQEKMN
jgi:hypothetical protein